MRLCVSQPRLRERIDWPASDLLRLIAFPGHVPVDNTDHRPLVGKAAPHI
jgi:hypothetical protein